MGVTETAETTVTDDLVTSTTERIQAKPSRSAELNSQEDPDTYAYDYAVYYKQYDISAEKFNHDEDDATDSNNAVHKDNSDGGEDVSTEAVERLHYRQASSASRSTVIHSVIMLVPSLLFFIYTL